MLQVHDMFETADRESPRVAAGFTPQAPAPPQTPALYRVNGEAHRRRMVPRLHLTLEQVENRFAALGHAIRLGVCPNLALDLQFDVAKVIDPHTNGRAALMAFLKLARQWVERKGHQTAYIWTLENRGDGDGYGLHAHINIYVPPALEKDFRRLMRGSWGKRAGMNTRTVAALTEESMPTAKAAKGKTQYISKDLDPQHWPIFTDATGRVHLDDRGKPSDQPVYGKKCGLSRNIDRAARAKAQLVGANDDDWGKAIAV